MPNPYRHTVPELIARYRLESTLRDVYVEGPRDQLFFEWFFSRVRASRAVVYSIAGVEIPAAALTAVGSAGNRGRVIALCEALAPALPKEFLPVIGIIDKDASELLNVSRPSRFLKVTDFSCLEAYVLTEAALRKFCKLYMGRAFPERAFSEAADILRELFLLRAAKSVVNPSARWIDEFTRCCQLDGPRLTFNRTDFVVRLVNVSNGTLDQGLLEGKVAELRRKLHPDLRNAVHGHDLVHMLSWLGRHMNVPTAVCNQTALQRALLTSAEYEELIEMPLLNELSIWSAL